jgi:shikimate kinase
MNENRLPPGAHLVLIGLRGAGKTTVGRLLSTRGHRQFFDLDDLVLRRLGADSVRAVFEGPGESVWRAGEAASCAALFDAPLPPAVIALGGGAPMLDQVATTLQAARRDGRAIVIHLRCPSSVAGERLGRAPGDRTSLTGLGVTQELDELARVRGPRYEELADAAVDASAAPDVVAASIEESAIHAARASQRPSM